MIKQTLLLFFALSAQISFSQGIDIDLLLLNGELPYRMNRKALMAAGLPIDSVTVVPEFMDGSDADSLIFIGKSYFEYYAQPDLCIMGSIIFDQKIRFAIYEDIRLTAATTLSEAKDFFYECCEKIEELSVYKETNVYKICGIPVVDKSGQLTEMDVILFFDQDLLTRIDLWEPL